ncbi:MAG: hypothetical protein IK115_07720 [Lachnospiraceae bacterium]|nr:hypothetical protein [Lachnospiraceae bacterium]
MTAAALLTKIKNYMRIRHNALDDTITDDINAGTLELTRAGVSVYEENEIRDDELILTAIRYHVMAAEDYNGKGSQYQQSFEKLRDAMSLSGEYRCETN